MRLWRRTGRRDAGRDRSPGREPAGGPASPHGQLSPRVPPRPGREDLLLPAPAGPLGPENATALLETLLGGDAGLSRRNELAGDVAIRDADDLHAGPLYERRPGRAFHDGNGTSMIQAKTLPGLSYRTSTRNGSRGRLESILRGAAGASRVPG
jgi:hypothetical protein